MEDLEFKPIPSPDRVLYADEMYRGAIDAMHLLAKSQIAATLIEAGWNPMAPAPLVKQVNLLFNELKGE